MGFSKTRAAALSETAFFAAAAAGSLWFAYLMARVLPENSHATSNMLLNGTADRPFQFRVLIPWLAGFLSRLMGLVLPVSPASWFRLTDFISVLLLVYVFRKYMSQFITGERAVKFMALSIMLILPFNFLLYPCFPTYYPYDMPAVLLFTLGLLLLYLKRWALYYPLFIIATLNKETACFLTVVYFLTEAGKSRPRTIAAHCLAQFSIWVAIKYGLYRLYLDNPGTGLFEDHLSFNLYFLARPGFYPYLFSSFGFTWIPVLFLHRRIKDDFARRSLLVAFPVLLVTLFMGRLHELRDYAELVPVVFTGFLIIFKGLYDKKRAFFV